MSIPTILVPLDGSNFAEGALPLAINTARKLKGRIDLVSVSPKKPNGRRRKEETISTEELNNLDSKRARYLEITAMRVEAASAVHVVSTVLRGSAAKALVKYSTIQHPEIIVMSTHGRGPLSRAWLGSVADWVVRHAEMPVMLVRPEEGADVDLTDQCEFGNVLVALDGSRQAEDSLRWAKAVGGEDTKYTLVRVARHSIAAWTVDTMYVPAYVDVRDYTDVVHAESVEYLRGVECLLQSGKQDVSSVVVDGVSPAEGILETAERKAADLIAITTHGRGGLPRLILGSVADKVVRASQVPVLVVRPSLQS